MNGAEMIAVERRRQIDVEGFTTEHDDNHGLADLPLAAHCYYQLAGIQMAMRTGRPGDIPTPSWAWPWEDKWWKPSLEPVRNLAKAGALFQAQIDFIERRGDLGITTTTLVELRDQCAHEIDTLLAAGTGEEG